MNKIYTVLIFVISFSLNGQENFNVTLLSNVSVGTESNDIWGYVDGNGIEYAVIGTVINTKIYSLEDPSSPILRYTASGGSSIWRDIKSYKNYLYVIADQGMDGIVIIDMTNAPNTITSKSVFPSTVSSNIFVNRCHNLYIDEETGILYLAGCNNNGGVLAFDLKTDPQKPKFIREISTNYAHDVFVQDNFVYASEFNEGQIAIYDIQNIMSPQLLGIAKTSSFATHNAWADPDNNFVYTTDEVSNGALDAYDIRDKSNPKRVDIFVPTAIKGQGFVPHNTHFHNDFLVTSWYTYGLVISDVSQPEKIVETGHFDTRLGFGEGAWGAYPYLPSGLILVSDITNGLFVLQPKYERAAYIGGTITDAATGLPIANASVKILSPDPNDEKSDPTGKYLAGQLSGGTFQVVFDHPEYDQFVFEVDLVKGTTINLNITLNKSAIHSRSFAVIDALTGQPIPGAQIQLQNSSLTYEFETNNFGEASRQIIEGEYTIVTGAWGYKYDAIITFIDTNDEITIALSEDYEDDFIFDYGWTNTAPNTRSAWVRVQPILTTYLGQASNPGADVEDDFGNLCYVTGNGPGGAGQYDVDAGTSTLYSPLMDLSEDADYTLSFYAWFFNAGGSGTPPNDEYLIFATNGIDTVTLVRITESTNGWQLFDNILLSDYLTLNSSVQVIFETADDEDGHLVEAGLDVFRIVKTLPSNTTDGIVNSEKWKLRGNPSNDFMVLFNKQYKGRLTSEIYTVTGQLWSVINQSNYFPDDEVIIPSPQQPGTYLLRIMEDGRFRETIKFVVPK